MVVLGKSFDYPLFFYRAPFVCESGSFTLIRTHCSIHQLLYFDSYFLGRHIVLSKKILLPRQCVRPRLLVAHSCYLLKGFIIPFIGIPLIPICFSHFVRIFVDGSPDDYFRYVVGLEDIRRLGSPCADTFPDIAILKRQCSFTGHFRSRKTVRIGRSVSITASAILHRRPPPPPTQRPRQYQASTDASRYDGCCCARFNHCARPTDRWISLIGALFRQYEKR